MLSAEQINDIFASYIGFLKERRNSAGKHAYLSAALDKLVPSEDFKSLLQFIDQHSGFDIQEQAGSTTLFELIARILPLEQHQLSYQFPAFEPARADKVLLPYRHLLSASQLRELEQGQGVSCVVANFAEDVQKMPLAAAFAESDLQAVLQQAGLQVASTALRANNIAAILNQARLDNQWQESYSVPVFAYIGEGDDKRWLLINYQVDKQHNVTCDIHYGFPLAPSRLALIKQELETAANFHEQVELAGKTVDTNAFAQVTSVTVNETHHDGFPEFANADAALYACLQVVGVKPISLTDEQVQAYQLLNDSVSSSLALRQTMFQLLLQEKGYAQETSHQIAGNAAYLLQDGLYADGKAVVDFSDLPQLRADCEKRNAYAGEFKKHLEFNRSAALHDDFSIHTQLVSIDPSIFFPVGLTLDDVKLRVQALVQIINQQQQPTNVIFRLKSQGSADYKLPLEYTAVITQALQQLSPVTSVDFSPIFNDDTYLQFKKDLALMANRNALLRAVNLPVSQLPWQQFYQANCAQAFGPGYGLLANDLNQKVFSFFPDFSPSIPEQASKMPTLLHARDSFLEAIYNNPKVVFDNLVQAYGNQKVVLPAKHFSLHMRYIAESGARIDGKKVTSLDNIAVCQAFLQKLQENRGFFSSFDEFTILLQSEGDSLNDEEFALLNAICQALNELKGVKKLNIVTSRIQTDSDADPQAKTISQEQLQALLALYQANDGYQLSLYFKQSFTYDVKDAEIHANEHIQTLEKLVMQRQHAEYKPVDVVEPPVQSYREELDYYRPAKRLNAVAVDEEVEVDAEADAEADAENDAEADVSQQYPQEEPLVEPNNPALATHIPFVERLDFKLIPLLQLGNYRFHDQSFEPGVPENYTDKCKRVYAETHANPMGPDTSPFVNEVGADLAPKYTVARLTHQKQNGATSGFAHSVYAVSEAAAYAMVEQYSLFLDGIPALLPAGFYLIQTMVEEDGIAHERLVLDYNLQFAKQTYHPLRQASTAPSHYLVQMPDEQLTKANFFAMLSADDPEKAQLLDDRFNVFFDHDEVGYDIVAMREKKESYDPRINPYIEVNVLPFRLFRNGANELKELFDLYRRKGTTAIEDLLVMLTQLQEQDANFYEHFLNAFVRTEVTNKRLDWLLTAEGYQAAQALFAMNDVDKLFWCQLVNHHFGYDVSMKFSDTGQRDSLADLFRAFNYFREQLQKAGITLTFDFPFASTVDEVKNFLGGCQNAFVAMDRLLTILTNINPHYLKDQVNYLTGLDYSNQGTVYAVLYDGYQFVHPAMQLNFNFSQNTIVAATVKHYYNGAGAKNYSTYHMDYAMLKWVLVNLGNYAAEDDVDYTSVDILKALFLRYLGSAQDRINARHFDRYVAIADQVLNLPHGIDRKLLPIVAKLCSGDRGYAQLNASALIAVVKEDLTADNAELLANLLDEIEPVIDSLAVRPTMNEFAGILRFVKQLPLEQSRKQFYEFLQVNDSPAALAAFALWNKRTNRIDADGILFALSSLQQSDGMSAQVQSELLSIVLVLGHSDVDEVLALLEAVARLSTIDHESCIRLSRNLLFSNLKKAVTAKQLSSALPTTEMLASGQPFAELFAGQLHRAISSAAEQVNEVSEREVQRSFKIEAEVLRQMLGYGGDAPIHKMNQLIDMLNRVGCNLHHIDVAGLTQANIIRVLTDKWKQIASTSQYSIGINLNAEAKTQVNDVINHLFSLLLSGIRQANLDETTIALLDQLYGKPYTERDGRYGLSDLKKVGEGVQATVDYAYAMTPMYEAVAAFPVEQRHAAARVMINSVFTAQLKSQVTELQNQIAKQRKASEKTRMAEQDKRVELKEAKAKLASLPQEIIALEKELRELPPKLESATNNLGVYQELVIETEAEIKELKKQLKQEAKAQEKLAGEEGGAVAADVDEAADSDASSVVSEDSPLQILQKELEQKQNELTQHKEKLNEFKNAVVHYKERRRAISARLKAIPGEEVKLRDTIIPQLAAELKPLQVKLEDLFAQTIDPLNQALASVRELNKHVARLMKVCALADSAIVKEVVQAVFATNLSFDLSGNRITDESLQAIEHYGDQIEMILSHQALTDAVKLQLLQQLNGADQSMLSIEELSALLVTIADRFPQEKDRFSQCIINIAYADVKPLAQVKQLVALLTDARLPKDDVRMLISHYLQPDQSVNDLLAKISAIQGLRLPMLLKIIANQPDVTVETIERLIELADERFDAVYGLYFFPSYPDNDELVELLAIDNLNDFSDKIASLDAGENRDNAKLYNISKHELKRVINAIRFNNGRALLPAEKDVFLNDLLFVNYLGSETPLIDVAKLQATYPEKVASIAYLNKPVSQLRLTDLQRAYNHLKTICRDPESPDNIMRRAQLSLIAIIREVIYRATGKHLRLVQLLPLISASRNNTFNEINTGQGKTIINGAMAALMHALGNPDPAHAGKPYPCYVLTSNKQLASEGYKDCKTIFDALGIKHHLVTGKSRRADICDDGINYGEMGDVALKDLECSVLGEPLQVGFYAVDEGDYLFDASSNYRYTKQFSGATENEDIGIILLIFKYISRPEYVRDGNKSIKDLVSLVKWVDQQPRVNAADKTKLKNFVLAEVAAAKALMEKGLQPERGYIGQLLDDVYTARKLLQKYNAQFSLRHDETDDETLSAVTVKDPVNQRKADDNAKFSGHIHTVMHALLDYYRCNPDHFANDFPIRHSADEMLTGDLREQHHDQRFKVPPHRPALAQMNGLAMIRRFVSRDGARLFASSGTMFSAWVEDLAVELGADIVKIPPFRASKLVRHPAEIIKTERVSVGRFGRRRKVIDADLTSAAHKARIVQCIIDGVKKGQPVLVFVASIEEAGALTAFINAELARKNIRVPEIQTYAEELDDVSRRKAHEDEVRVKAGKPRQITIATTLLSRGTDISPGQQPGLRVINTSTHGEPDGRGARQRAGRAARQEDMGEEFSIYNPFEFKEDVRDDEGEHVRYDDIVTVPVSGLRGKKAEHCVERLRDIHRLGKEELSIVKNRFNNARIKVEDAYINAVGRIVDDVKTLCEQKGLDFSAYKAKAISCALTLWKDFYNSMDERWRIIKANLDAEVAKKNVNGAAKLEAIKEQLDLAITTFQETVAEQWPIFMAAVAGEVAVELQENGLFAEHDAQAKKQDYEKAPLDFTHKVSRVGKTFNERFWRDVNARSVVDSDLTALDEDEVALSPAQVQVRLGFADAATTLQGLFDYLNNNCVLLRKVGIRVAQPRIIVPFRLLDYCEELLLPQIRALLVKSITSANAFVYKNLYWQLLDALTLYEAPDELKQIVYDVHVQLINELYTHEIANLDNHKVSANYQQVRILMQQRLFDFNQRGLLPPGDHHLNLNNLLTFKATPMLRTAKGRLLRVGGEVRPGAVADEGDNADAFRWQQLYRYAQLQIQQYKGAWWKSSDRKLLLKNFVVSLAALNESEDAPASKVAKLQALTNKFENDLFNQDSNINRGRVKLRNQDGSRFERMLRNIRAKAVSFMHVNEELFTDEMSAINNLIANIISYKDKLLQTAQPQNRQLLEGWFAKLESCRLVGEPKQQYKQLHKLLDQLKGHLSSRTDEFSAHNEKAFLHMADALLTRLMRLDASVKTSPELRQSLVDVELEQLQTDVLKLARAKSLPQQSAVKGYIQAHYANIVLPDNLSEVDRYRCQLILHAIKKSLYKEDESFTVDIVIITDVLQVLVKKNDCAYNFTVNNFASRDATVHVEEILLQQDNGERIDVQMPDQEMRVQSLREISLASDASRVNPERSLHAGQGHRSYQGVVGPHFYGRGVGSGDEGQENNHRPRNENRR